MRVFDPVVGTADFLKTCRDMETDENFFYEGLRTFNRF